jgi:predicted nucleic-acid-binding protein
MIAIDTNVVVRFLTRDDPAQATRAKSLIETRSIFLPKTVMLETEWVLRTRYRFERAAIAGGLTKLLGLPGVEAEDAATVAQALELHSLGFDFADGLHLASSRRAEGFATFDRALQGKSSVAAEVVAVVAP